nr:CvpA family protein [Ardenticatena sp.]
MWIDIVLLLILIGSMLAGFSQGTVWQLVNIGALYFGLSVASGYYMRVTRLMRQYLGPSDTLTRDTIVFLAIVLGVWGAIVLATRYSFRGLSIKTGRTFDQLGGMIIGLITGFIWCLLLLLVLGFVTSVPWPDYNGARMFIVNGLRHSFLRPFVLGLLPLVVEAISPWLPGGTPPIFTAIFSVIR